MPWNLADFPLQRMQIMESMGPFCPLNHLLSNLIHYQLYLISQRFSQIRLFTPFLYVRLFFKGIRLISCAWCDLQYSKQARMQQIDLLENVRRDLGEDEDLQMIHDHDEKTEEKQLKNKIIFSMQGLGGVRTIKRNDRLLEAYIKGQHCEESVKDLVKFIRSDTSTSPKARFILADYNIIETDLLELLILQVQDKKLSFWIIALLALLTAKPGDDLSPDEKQKLNNSLREYKNSFVKKECFQILMVHIADFYKTPQNERLRAHLQLMEFIIVLVRNLVQIPNSEKFPHLHNHFLAAFVKEDMFNPLLYIVQTDRSELMSKIDIPLLEIFYHTFTCFEPKLLFSSNQTSIFKKVLNLKMGQRPVPTRHSRFQPNFRVKTESGVTKLVHTLTPDNSSANKNLKKQPVRMTEIKKVTKIQSDKFSENFMKIQIQSQGQLKTIGEVVLEMSREFLEVEFEQLVKLVFDSIFKETAKVTDNNVIQYLLLCSWALQVVRAKYHKERAQAENDVAKDRVEFNFGWIVDVMQSSHFQLIYKILAREANREKRKEFKVNFFHAGMKLFSSYLDVIWDISNSMNMSQRKNANVLMANIFRHDIAKILRIGFHNIAHDGVVSLVIKVSHKFFRLLSVYSQGKVLTIQTSKLIKRKKKNREDHQNEQEDQLNQFQEDDDKEEGKHGNALEEERYQQRKYNEKSEFAIIAEYAIITKYLSFLKNDRFLLNSEDLNEAIFYYIRQIKKLLSGEWLFFQAETLCVFQKIISNHDWAKKNAEKVKLLQSICISFVKLLRKNPLALTESLFRFSSLSLKDHILRNYSDEYIESGVREDNMFTDQ